MAKNESDSCIRDDKKVNRIDYHSFIYYVWFTGLILYRGVIALLDLKSQIVEPSDGFFKEIYVVAFFLGVTIDMILIHILYDDLRSLSYEKDMSYDVIYTCVLCLSDVVVFNLNWPIMMVVLLVIVVAHSLYTIRLIRKEVVRHLDSHRLIKENLFDSYLFNRLALQIGSGLVASLALVINLVRKLRTEKQQPFEIDDFFVNMSVVTISVAALTSWILVCIKWCTRNSNKEIPYKILNIAFCFSIIVSPVSLLLSCVPHNLNVSGIFIIFVIIVAYNVSGNMMKLFNKNVNYNLEDQKVAAKKTENNHLE